MFDELERLRVSSELLALLEYYVLGGDADRTVWVDRISDIHGVDGRALTRLHGELIAYGWLEINLDPAGPRKPDTVVGCYRATKEGAKAHRETQLMKGSV